MLPESSLNATAALVDSVLGTYSDVDILLQGHLSSDICRGQLTKNLREWILKNAGTGHGPCTADGTSLANLASQMTDELGLAMSALLGECQKGSKWRDLPQTLWDRRVLTRSL